MKRMKGAASNIQERGENLPRNKRDRLLLYFLDSIYRDADRLSIVNFGTVPLAI